MSYQPGEDSTAEAPGFDERFDRDSTSKNGGKWEISLGKWGKGENKGKWGKLGAIGGKREKWCISSCVKGKPSSIWSFHTYFPPNFIFCAQ